MQKTGLKTFAYSFSVSLFAIFAANGIYLHSHNPSVSNIKIPNKNIVLFLKAEPAAPSKLAAPTKKIALSVLPEIENLDFDEPQIIMADDFDLHDTPLDVSNEPTSHPDVLAPPLPIAPVAAELLVSDVSTENTIEMPPAKVADISVENFAEDLFIPLQSQDFGDVEVLQPEDLRADTDHANQALTEVEHLLPIEKGQIDILAKATKVYIGTSSDLNQVALVDKNVPIESMEKAPKETPDSNEKPQEWQDMAEKQPDASPWIVAKAEGAVKNQALTEEEFFNKELSVQPSQAKADATPSGTAKNLLIPIPEEILKTENLVPKLSISPATTQIAKDETVEEKPLEEKKPTNNILSSLNSLFKSEPQTQKTPTPSKKNILSSLKNKLKKKETLSGKIMPTEMRLSFQPNRAEISGQTLRWIQAFATKVAEDNSMAIEIRIDGTSAMELQQKRLNLLHNILANKGVTYSKINTVFTQREPNSFILRTRTFNNKGAKQILNKIPTQHYQQW